MKPIGYACSRTQQVVWDRVEKFGPCDQCVPITSLHDTPIDVHNSAPLVAFALAVLKQWHGDGERGDIDGAWLQETALAAGVCRKEIRATPCGERCACAEFSGHGEALECIPIVDEVWELVKSSGHA